MKQPAGVLVGEWLIRPLRLGDAVLPLAVRRPSRSSRRIFIGVLHAWLVEMTGAL